MKTNHGAGELPDTLVAKENELARVSIISTRDLDRLLSDAERKACLEKPIIDSWWRSLWPFNRRKR